MSTNRSETALADIEAIIRHMQDCGWVESELDGMITNPRVTDDTYNTWLEAIKSCIEVASEA